MASTPVRSPSAADPRAARQAARCSAGVGTVHVEADGRPVRDRPPLAVRDDRRARRSARSAGSLAGRVDWSAAGSASSHSISRTEPLNAASRSHRRTRASSSAAGAGIRSAGIATSRRPTEAAAEAATARRSAGSGPHNWMTGIGRCPRWADQAAATSLGDGRVRRRQVGRWDRSDRLDHAGQPLVQDTQPDQVMQHALVDPQWRDRQCRARPDLDQSPPP